MKYRFSKFVSIISIAAMTLSSIGCEKTPEDPGNTPGGEDKGEFSLTYAEPTSLVMTPSGNDLVIKAPEHTGAIPYGFIFSNITKDGATFSDEKENFVIAADNGQIKITNTAELPLGDYKLSVKCFAEKKEYDNPDVISVKVIALLKDIVKVTPSEYAIDLKDLLAEGFVSPEFKVELTEPREGADLRIASVTTSAGEAVNPAAYFDMTDNVITIKAVEIPSDVYSVNIGVKTADDEGVAENAFTLTVKAAPYDLSYSPAKIETKEQQAAKTASATVKGNKNGLAYSFGSVVKVEGETETPVADEWIGTLFVIDEATGLVTVDPSAMGETEIAGSYAFDILVKNADSEEGVLFENALTAEIAPYKVPVTEFSYPAKETTTYSVSEVKGQVIKATVNEDAQRPLTFTWSVTGTDKANFELDETTGDITVKEALPRGTYTINVTVNNPADQKKTAKIEIEVYDPSYFTYFSYGNNYEEQGIVLTADQKKEIDGISMVRLDPALVAGGVYPDFAIEIKETDIRDLNAVSWDAKVQDGTATVSIEKGKLNISGFKPAALSPLLLVFVTAKTETVEITVPVFVNCPMAVTNTGSQFSTGKAENIEFIPFVVRANPNKGTVTPAIGIQIGDLKPESFKVGYKDQFDYHNIDGEYEDGTPLVSGRVNSSYNFMYDLWALSATDINNVNLGSRVPLLDASYLTETCGFTRQLIDMGYFDGALKMIIYGSNWISQNYTAANKGTSFGNTHGKGVADGVFAGRVGVTDTGKDGYNGRAVRNIFVWFDKDYEPAK